MGMEPIILREFRKMPFCRQDKTVLRKINNQSNRKELSAIRNTYFTLTEIASNQENEKISTFLFDIAKLSWLSEKTISKCLDYLKDLWIVFIQPQERWTDGRYKNKEIWLIGNNPTAGKFKKSSKKVWGKFKKSSVSQVSDNKEDSLEDIIENKEEDSVEGWDKSQSPTSHKNIDFINWMRDVEIRGNSWLKNWNEKTGRQDIMNDEIKKAMYAMMKNVTFDIFEQRISKYVDVLWVISEKKLKSYIFFQVWEYDFLQFLSKINQFYGDVPTILSKIARNEFKTKIIGMIKKSEEKVHVEEPKKKILTEEEKKEINKKFKEQCTKLQSKMKINS